MTKRNVLGKRRSHFGDDDEDNGDEGQVTHEDVNAHLMRTLRSKEAQRIVAKPINIFDITPDPLQPRRALPSNIRQHWDGDPQSMGGLLASWWSACVGADSDGKEIHAMLLNLDVDEKVPVEQEPDVLYTAFLDLVDLASSIRREGLTNPITIARHQEHFRIETGERRWMAYHLLYSYFDGKDGRPNEQDQWQKIPARLVDEFDVWRQATENTARRNLNAIGKARQFAILLMDLLGQENFNPIDQFETEQAFYAQVADGNAYRVPRGKGQQLLSAMGLNNSVQLRQYRALLRLPSELWMYADDANLSEHAMREYIEADEAQANPQPPVEEKPPRAPRWVRDLSRFERTLEPDRWQRLPKAEKRSAYNRLKQLLEHMERLGLD